MNQQMIQPLSKDNWEASHMVFRAIRVLVGLVAITYCTGAGAAPILNAINHNEGDKDQLVLRLELSEPVSEPRSFTIDNPPRIAIDLPGTKLAVAEKLMQVNKGNVRNVRSVESGGKTRVVIDLIKLTPYTLKTVDSSLVVTFEEREVAQSTASSSGRNVKSQKAAKNVNAIDFRRGVDGQGQLFITLSDPSTVIDVDERQGKISLKILATRLPENLERRLDVVDFATPITTIDALNASDGVSVVLSTHGNYQYMAYQTADTYTVEVRPMTEAEVEAKKEKYTGEKLSLNFQNIEVRAVLQLLADFTGLNIVASDTVQGNITLRLKNVPWDQAMDIVLKTRGLGMRQNGDVIMVAPNAELAALEKQELESKKQIEDVSPLKTRFYAINYAKAADIAKLLKSDKNSILSSRGSVTIDDRTNTLMVLETDDRHADLESLIKKLDVPVRQVLIESRIVIASNDYGKELGSKFGVNEISNFTVGTNPGTATTSGTLNGTNTTIQNVLGGGGGAAAFSGTVSDRLNTNFGAGGSAARIALSILGSDYLVDLELSALQREGKGEVLSNPRVITANQKEAKIEQGVEVPYQSVSSSGTNVQFKKAVLSMSVTPQITPDDRVIMDLKVTKDSVGQIVGGIPSINKREINTQVLVANGDTVVLGGIYEQSRAEGEEKVPFLGDIPLIGALFRHRSASEAQSELLIFVSPKIIKEGLQASLN